MGNKFLIQWWKIQSHAIPKHGDIVLINIALQMKLNGRIDLNYFLNTKKVESGSNLIK